MPVDVRVKVDSSLVERALSRFADQIPFATSKALNLTGKDAVSAVKGDLSETFTIRSKWEASGITFNPSNKKDLRIEVGSRHDYMAAQAEGGEKTPKSGGNVAVPMVGKGAPRATLKTQTRPSKWPGALAQKPGHFVGVVNGTLGLWKRIKGTKDKDPSVRLLYRFSPSVKVEPRWPLEKQVEAVVQDRWPINAKKAVEDAIKTARK